MDVHVPRPITVGLRLRGVDVLTAQEDDTALLADDALLDRATALGRVLVTSDSDLLIEAAKRQKHSSDFNGVIYAHPLRVPIGLWISDLELIAKSLELIDFMGRVEYLPL